MIKKINVALFVLFACLFGLKVLLDAAANAKAKKGHAARVAAVAPTVSQIAPHVYYTRWAPHFSPNRMSNRNGLGLDILREIFPRATYDCTRDTTDLEEVRKILDSDPLAIVVGHSTDVPELAGYPMPTYPVSACSLAIYVPRTLDWKYTGPESMDSLRLGVMSEYAHAPVLEAFSKKWAGTPGKLQIVTSRDVSASAFKSLVQEKKIDGFVTAWAALDLSLSTEESDTFLGFRRSKPIGVCGLYFRVSKNDPNLARQIVAEYEKGYEALRKKGVLRRFAEYYLTLFGANPDAIFGQGGLQNLADGLQL